MATPERRQLVEQLLGQWGRHLLAYARRFVGVGPAEEMVQETFLRLWQVPAEEILLQPQAWLFTVCRRLCIDYVRKNARLQVVDPEHFVTHAATHVTFQPEAGDTMDQTQAVEQVLSQLTTQQQEAVRLKFLHDRSYKEIALVMSISVSHVGVLLHQALKRVRALQPAGGVL